ncbi:hypothetical protein H6P81_010095 [Aristolochia fimbriata]|uniref:Uncharacterized protein n=1 Tax=Aristolochia fimbriata TaxID=158543 RepID=A0AAV7EPX7_ARIFI|nr:hypothetical protein H6P81_010095 [Aristolochia fimbriata]
MSYSSLDLEKSNCFRLKTFKRRQAPGPKGRCRDCTLRTTVVRFFECTWKNFICKIASTANVHSALPALSPVPVEPTQDDLLRNVSDDEDGDRVNLRCKRKQPAKGNCSLTTVEQRLPAELLPQPPLQTPPSSSSNPMPSAPTENEWPTKQEPPLPKGAATMSMSSPYSCLC